MDLRGFGESTTRPHGALSHTDDVLTTLRELDIQHAHVIGASLGAGVAVEVALNRPELVESLLLSAPGGSLIAEMTPQLRAFIDAEGTALDQGDVDAAVDANVAWWVAGPHRSCDGVDSEVIELVRSMQRQAFDLTADWDDVEESEMDPPPFERLSEITVPTLILLGALDLDAIHETAKRLVAGISDARLVEWPDTAHLPSMERPDDFRALVEELTKAG